MLSQREASELEAQISRAMAKTPELLESPTLLRLHFDYLAKLKDQRPSKTIQQIEHELGLRDE